MNKEFDVHMLNEAGKFHAKAIAEAFDLLLETLTNATREIPGSGAMAPPLCPPSRETSLMRTKLEEACFFAKKAMASTLGNSGNP